MGPEKSFEDRIRGVDSLVTLRGDTLNEDWRFLRSILLGEHFQRENTPVIILSPETGKLSPQMGPRANFAYKKRGGLADIAQAQCKGLMHRGIDTHLVTLNLSRAFKDQMQADELAYSSMIAGLPPDRIHLVGSEHIKSLDHSYVGDTVKTALQLQIRAISVIKELRQQYFGKGIVVANDWMTAGLVSSYCKLRGIPLLDITHNSHTGLIPMSMVHATDEIRQGMDSFIYRRFDPFTGIECMDSKATGIKNASLSAFVGGRFLYEIVHDYFMDRTFIPESIRAEVKAKHRFDLTVVLPNPISPDFFPENQATNPNRDAHGLAASYSPQDSYEDIQAAKSKNLRKFQYQMGLNDNPEVILLYWPSRFDNTQKGTELLDRDMLKWFLRDNLDVQIAFVGDAANPESTQHVAEMVKLQRELTGRVAYRPFDQDLSTLGYAAAAIVFGASLYEPFGQIDALTWIYGALSLNRNTGGYHDKMLELTLAMGDELEEPGKGVLFNTYNVSGLEYGLRSVTQQYRELRRNPDAASEKLHGIMRYSREIWDLDRTMERYYLPTLVRLNSGRPLIA